MYLAALILTVAGWAFQAYETLIKKTRSISVILPFTYCVACILFGITSLAAGDILYAVLDLIVAILAALVFVVLVIRK
jgi:hypothetical protein